MRLVACAAAPSVDPRVRRVAHLVQPREVVVAADGEVEAGLLGADHVADQVLRPGLLGHHRVAQLHAHAARLPPADGGRTVAQRARPRSASRSFTLPLVRSSAPGVDPAAEPDDERDRDQHEDDGQRRPPTAATSPAACRTGITSGESPGTKRGDRRPGRRPGSPRPGCRRRRPPTSTSVVGMMHACRGPPAG